MSEDALVFTIDQAVHGYRGGHRWLAGSLQLDDRSAATMLGLSDLLAEPRGSESYLVGYPLKESNRYVLARTWIAYEMPRPGCVWTHSLIFDYSTLARIADPSALLELHSRPTLSSLADFSGQISVREAPVAQGHDVLDADRAWAAIAGVYTGTGAVHLVAQDGEGDERLALAIWRQMWSRMRRSFFFCSATIVPLSPVAVEASLQFLVTSTPEVGDAGRHKKLGEGLVRGVDALVRDLPEQGETGLRRFLARYTPDFVEHRTIAPQLATLFEELAMARTVAQLRKAVSSIDRNLPVGEGRLLKADLLLGHFRLPDLLGEAAARDFATTLEVFSKHQAPAPEDKIIDYLVELQEAGRIKASEIIDVTASSEPGTLGGIVLNNYVHRFPKAVAAAKLSLEAKFRVADINPALLEYPSFWDVSPEDRPRLVDVALEYGVEPYILLESILPSITAEEATRLASLNGATSVGVLLENLAPGAAVTKALASWAPLVGQFPEALRRAMPQLVEQPEVLNELATYLLGTPAEFALDDQALALVVERWEAQGLHLPALAAISFIRGLNRNALKSEALIRFGFDALVGEVLSHDLSPKIVSMLEGRLIWANNYSPGSLLGRCFRAVAACYIEADRADPWILKFTKNVGNLEIVLALIEEKYRGRNLLKKLHEKIEKKGLSVPNETVRMLEHCLWPWRG